MQNKTFTQLVLVSFLIAANCDWIMAQHIAPPHGHSANGTGVCWGGLPVLANLSYLAPCTANL